VDPLLVPVVPGSGSCYPAAAVVVVVAAAAVVGD